MLLRKGVALATPGSAHILFVMLNNILHFHIILLMKLYNQY